MRPNPHKILKWMAHPPGSPTSASVALVGVDVAFLWPQPALSQGRSVDRQYCQKQFKSERVVKVSSAS